MRCTSAKSYGRYTIVATRPRVPKAAISRYMRRLAQSFSGDVDLRLSLEIDCRRFHIWIIRLTPGFVQVVLHIVVYEACIRQKELERLQQLMKLYPSLYEILSEHAGRVLEIRCFLCDNRCKFYVWARNKSWVKLLLPVVKEIYRQFRKHTSLHR